MSLHMDVLKHVSTNGNNDEFSIAGLKAIDCDGNCASIHHSSKSNTRRYHIGDGCYANAAISSVIASHATDADGNLGYEAKKRGAKYLRIAAGRYAFIDPRNPSSGSPRRIAAQGLLNLIAENESRITINVKGSNASKQRARDCLRLPAVDLVDETLRGGAVSIIVETLASSRYPFQIYDLKTRKHHPKAPVSGWEKRLSEYRWNGENFDDNSPVLQELQTRLYDWKKPDNRSSTELHDIYEAIKKWGNPRGAERSAEELREQVELVLENFENGELPEHCEIDSTLTKLYALLWPDQFAIYDSRVATAIQWLLDPFINELRQSEEFMNEYAALGTISSDGGTRPRTRLLNSKWGNAYKRWDSQLAANRLLTRATSMLNERYPRKRGKQWNLREVEAVLFMEGY